MKLSKAIEILSLRVKDYIPGYDPYEREATQLGIEAEKWFIAARKGPVASVYNLLPGETEE